MGCYLDSEESWNDQLFTDGIFNEDTGIISPLNDRLNSKNRRSWQGILYEWIYLPQNRFKEYLSIYYRIGIVYCSCYGCNIHKFGYELQGRYCLALLCHSNVRNGSHYATVEMAVAYKNGILIGLYWKQDTLYPHISLFVVRKL